MTFDNNIFKKTLSVILCFTLALSICIYCQVDARAASAGADIKGKTVCEALGMDGAAYMNWLESHEHDNYYLGTPYRPYDHRNPNGDCKGAYGTFDVRGQPGMNCMGFVWHVLYKATGYSGGNMTYVNKSMGRLSFYRGLNITRRYFANKQEMLDSGYAEKGDIIWMILDQNENVNNQYDHTGIYWGDGHSDVLWHSNTVTGGQGSCNAISAIYPMKDRNTMYIVLKVGAKKLDSPRLTAAVNTDEGIKVTWDKVDGAARYRYYIRKGEEWIRLGDTTGTTFVYKDAAFGEECTFTVRCVTAVNKGFTSWYDTEGISCVRGVPGEPETVLPTDSPTEPPTEAETEAATQMPTEVPTEVSTIAPTETPTELQPVCLLGDVDSDEEVTVLDATLIRRHLLDIPTFAFNEAAADADEDRSVTILDATMIQWRLAGFPSNENIGKPISRP